MEKHSKKSNVFPNGGTFKSVLRSNITQPSSIIMEEPSEQYCVIPDDILFKEILPKVPTKSLLRFKGVSRSWLARISSDTTFIADHTAHHSTAPTEFTLMYGSSKQPSLKVPHVMFILSHGDLKVVEIDTSYIRESHNLVSLLGTCNGLACIAFDLGPDLFIWNPVTREHRHLREPTRPKVNHRFYSMSSQFCLGFGKDTYIDYKLVRLMEIKCKDVETIIDVQLFTKRSGRWRHLNGFSGLKLLGIGLMVNGTMYWAIRYETPRHQGRAFDVLSFDFCAEVFQELEGPPPTSDESCKWVEFIKWKGCLGAVLMNNDKTRYQLWLRTRNNDDNEKNNFCWKNVTVDPSLHPLHDSRVVKDRLSFGSERFFGMCDHMPSLVSPN